MQVYYNQRNSGSVPPWNPNLEIYSETVLGDGLEVLPDVGSTASGTPSDAAVELAKILQVEHDLYKRYFRQWTDALAWFNGDSDIVNYIWSHPRERKEHYLRRQQRGYYWNYTESIIGLIASFIYSKTITRSLSDESAETSKAYLDELEEFWKNVDRMGTNADEFFKTTLVYLLVFGLGYVMVDKPAMPKDANGFTLDLSEQQRKDLGISPYLYTIPTLSMTNWRLKRDGSFLWCRWYTDVEVGASPFMNPSTSTVKRYMTWGENEWFAHDVITPKRGKPYALLIDSGDNPLGEVPIVRLVVKKDLTDQNFGKSLAYIIGKINVAILNYLSLLDEDLYGKCLNLLAVQVDDVMPSENSNAPPQDPVTIGANNVLTYTSLSQPPFYLAPSSNPGDLLMNHIRACTDQIYRIALFGGATAPVAPYSEKSGTAYAHEFNETNRMLSEKSNSMERGEIQVCRLWAKWMGLDKTGIGFIVDYPDEFHVEELAKELKDVMESQKIVTSSHTFTVEMQKRVVRRMIDHDFRGLIDTINAEIEANALSPMEAQEKAMADQQALAEKSQEKSAEAADEPAANAEEE
jgi:hypothetical protein